MNRIIAAIREFFRSLQNSALQYRYRFSEFAASDDGWLEEDSKRLNELFVSPTGRKLKARMTNYVLQCAVEATQVGTPFHCGIARGVALAVTAVENHFASSLRSGDNPESQQPPSVADGFALN